MKKNIYTIIFIRAWIHKRICRSVILSIIIKYIVIIFKVLTEKSRWH